jgi:bifunctional non-homologous end joining protein LigD
MKKSSTAKKRRFGEYRAKRDFGKTPEPPPRPVAERPAARATFMVHKHHAGRLHYDLRLEIDGALASWAVPRGPSLDPSVKRLAVETEDHPLEYGGFEGRIPDGEYGAGDSLIWDRGTYETVPPGQASEQRRQGRLTLQLDGEKLHGRWHLVRTRWSEGGKPSWLLFKAADAAADRAHDIVAARPESVVSGRVASRGPERAAVLRAAHPAPETLLERVWPPMLASLAHAPPDDAGAWVIEDKYDGFRALCALSGGRLAMWSRNRLDLASRFPRVAAALSRLVVGEAVLDGEVAALDRKGQPRFQLLQRSGKHAAEEALFAFDLLWLDGQDLRARPLEERRDLLASLLANAGPPLLLARRLPESFSDALADVRARGGEGLLAKRRGSHYQGRRSEDWIKLKVTGTQEVVVVGFTPSEAAPRTQIGALLMALREGNQYAYCGKVGTGFSAAQRVELHRTLSRFHIGRPPVSNPPRMRGLTWVEPLLVIQVRFAEWTSDGKMRAPAFLGIRLDKAPEECVREAWSGLSGSRDAPPQRS